ncbi:MAG: S-layer homology domain-containing protein [Ruminococcaceae bacterium]|nr:S-layer homology domain-containing protein [Oscillospiraceae bacterium]
MKRFLILMLTFSLILTSVPTTSLASGVYFTDVPTGAWYYQDVHNAVGQGLINGKSETTYAPEDNLTCAEAVKLASCMHKLSTEGNVNFEPTVPWYTSFVNYAKENNIITKDYNWNSVITRAEYMEIFSKALPAEQLPDINNVEDDAIPDVPMTHPLSSSIYKLYRAGIVQGNDSLYSCNPDDNIKRSEVAVILTRMMNVAARRTFSVTIPEYRKLYHTGYAAYDAKIYEYYQAMAADENFFNSSDWSAINDLMVYYARQNNGTLYYSLCDINTNGVPELIFSNGTGFIDIYTLNNGKLVTIFENCYFGERSRLHILADGTLLNEGSDSAFGSSCCFYQLNADNTLTQTEAYYCDTNGPTYMTQVGYTYISTNEYVDKVSYYLSYSVFNALDWKPFADKQTILKKSYYDSAMIAMANSNYLQAVEQLKKAEGYLDAATMILECYYQYGKKQMSLNYTTTGIEYLSKCNGYKDANEILKAYYYEEGVDAFEDYIAIFPQYTFTQNVTNAYQKVLDTLTLCKDYKDSNRLLQIAETLYSAWYNMDAASNFKASFGGMNVSVTNDAVTITKDCFISGSDNSLDLTFHPEQPGFTAKLKDMFSYSIRSYNEVLILCALVDLFTDVEQTEDLAIKLSDSDEWSSNGTTESFSMNYGGYQIEIDVDTTNRYSLDCVISVTK